jgi:hypothetical protein
MSRSGQRSVRSPAYLVLARPRQCVSGCVMPRSMQAHGPVSKPLRVDSSDASSAANLHLRITKRCGLVLSQTHMYETQKRQEWEKRLDVVETMVELSRFHAITHVTNASWCAEVNATVHSEICGA